MDGLVAIINIDKTMFNHTVGSHLFWMIKTLSYLLIMMVNSFISEIFFSKMISNCERETILEIIKNVVWNSLIIYTMSGNYTPFYRKINKHKKDRLYLLLIL